MHVIVSHFIMKITRFFPKYFIIINKEVSYSPTMFSHFFRFKKKCDCKTNATTNYLLSITIKARPVYADGCF
jgi:hypothetical protein